MSSPFSVPTRPREGMLRESWVTQGECLQVTDVLELAACVFLAASYRCTAGSLRVVRISPRKFSPGFLDPLQQFLSAGVVGSDNCH